MALAGAGAAALLLLGIAAPPTPLAVSMFRLVPIFLVLLAAGCDYPRDAEGTFERVQGGVLRAGVTANPPWVIDAAGEPAGIEPRLIRAFAASQGARVEWVRGSEAALTAALEARHIDLLAAGLTRDTPWKRRGALTVPYLEARLIIAAPPDAMPPAEKSDFVGRTVAYRTERPDIAARLAEAGAVPAPAQRFGNQLAAIYEFESGRAGLTPTPVVLATEKHVLMAAPGESRFLLALDEFLVSTGRRLALAEQAP